MTDVPFDIALNTPSIAGPRADAKALSQLHLRLQGLQPFLRISQGLRLHLFGKFQAFRRNQSFIYRRFELVKLRNALLYLWSCKK